MRPRYDTVTVTTGFIQSSYWYAVLEQLKVSISFEAYCCIQIDRLNQIELIAKARKLTPMKHFVSRRSNYKESRQCGKHQS